MDSYFQKNDNKINSNLQQVEKPRNEISESISEASKIPLETLSQNQQYKIQLQIRIKLKIGQITSLWAKSRKRKRLKLFKHGFNVKQKARYL